MTCSGRILMEKVTIEETHASGDPNVIQVLNTSLCLMKHDETEV